MHSNDTIKSFRFVPRLWAACAYPLLLTIGLLLFFGRSYPSLRSRTLTGVLPDLYSHVSNFSLSLVVYTTVGYVGLMQGLTSKHLVAVGLAISLLNLGYEGFVPVLNVRDWIDGVYGVAGVCLGFGFLYSTRRWGLKRPPA